jgi:hypothetical protein
MGHAIHENWNELPVLSYGTWICASDSVLEPPNSILFEHIWVSVYKSKSKSKVNTKSESKSIKLHLN